MSQIVRAVGILVLALYYAAIGIFQLLKLTYNHGPRFVFGRKPHPKPAVLSDPSLGSHGFLHLEQVRLHYVASGPEDKPLMLFLHGFPEFWYSWRHQIREFQKDYRCVAIDQRGYGESDKPAAVESYAVPTLLKDIKQAIQALGYKSCILVAHDWGGGIAWAFGRLFPDMVDKLIVMNAPPGPAGKEVFENNKDQMKMSWYMLFFQLPYLPELFMRCCDFSAFDRLMGKDVVGPDGYRPLASPAFHVDVPAEDIEAYKYTYSQPGTLTSTINWYRAAIRGKPVVYDMDYPMPCLFIWGMNDNFLHHDMVVAAERLNPKITVRRIKEACHFVQLDTPTAVNHEIRAWLDQQ